MANHVAVKAILQYPEGLELGSSPDVRRFQIDKGTDNRGDLYKRLQDTLTTSVFPDIQGLDYSLQYKDDDGDMVQISSMSELQAAIDSMSDSDKVLRLYILVETDLTEGEVTGTSSDEEKVPKRVRFSNAGKKFRRKIRRRRKKAVSELVVSKEYRKAVRVIVRLVHKAQRQPGTPVVEPTDEQDKAALAALSPEVVAFVRKIVDDWHTKLSKKRPRMVGKQIRKQNRSTKTVDRDHFQWLCRFMARWHRRNAGKCEVMSGWSSGETGEDTSGDEEEMVKMIRKRRELRRLAGKGPELLKAAAPPNVSDSEGTDADDDVDESSDDKVSQDFRKEIRVMMRQFHRKGKDKPAAEKKEKEAPPPTSVMSPEVKAFAQQLLEDWHAALATTRPRAVYRTIRKEKKKTLPAGLDKEAFGWVCRFFARWHHRNAEACEAMAGWSSGLDTGDEGVDKKKKKRDKKKKEKKEKKKDKKDKKEKKDKKKDKKDKKKDKKESSSDSDSDDAEPAEDPVSNEFRKDVRTLVGRIHKTKAGPKKDDKPPADKEQPALASLSPEVQSFIKQLLDDWHTSLSQKPPRVVLKTMMKKEDAVPASMDAAHFRFLCRFVSRWHRKNAGRCDVMSGWSSGETADETSADEERARKRRAARRAKAMEDTFSQSEDTDCQEKACKPLSSEFRDDVRVCIGQLHKKKREKPKDESKEKKTPTTISPEVQSFLAEFSEEWHTRLASSGKRPRGVSKEMKEGELRLPAGMERDQYNWLCCYMARWHCKHAGKCDAMSGLLS